MTAEKIIAARSGWDFLVRTIVLYVLAVACFVLGAIIVDRFYGMRLLGGLTMGLAAPLLLVTAIFFTCGFFILPPNTAAVLLLFGKYKGTVKQEGFCWTNPFYTKKKISVRMHNLNGDRLKVNDQEGNPIEIAAVVVWRVSDTYRASFEVEDYLRFVSVQSESALRHLATSYPYDSWAHESVISLRGNIDEVSVALERELQSRLEQAGVEVLEARLSHLAYAPEIAEAMLRRQQAGAIIAARQKIVEGAVGMVKMALNQLSEEGIIDLDGERRAAMVSNLLVVLCGEARAQPVINAGTLYS